MPLLPLMECFAIGGGSGSFSWESTEPRTESSALVMRLGDNNYSRNFDSAKFPGPGVTVSVWKRFEFLIRSVNHLKTARQKIVNQSENGYG